MARIVGETTGRRSGTTGTSRIGPYRRSPLCFHLSACLVIDGTVVASAEEERFSRRKHHKDSRSCAVAAAYCLSEAGIAPADVDEIANAATRPGLRRATSARTPS